MSMTEHVTAGRLDADGGREVELGREEEGGEGEGSCSSSGKVTQFPASSTVCVYVCVHMCVYMCVYMCVHMCVYVCVCVYVHICAFFSFFLFASFFCENVRVCCERKVIFETFACIILCLCS